MGTMAITSSGFANLPAQAPNNWPSNITWPASGIINGTKNYTITDADAQQILSWIATTYNAQLIEGKTPPPPFTVPALQIYVAWLDGFMTATTDSVQRQQVTPPVVPPPINITT
jgi:hypothetical protein